MKYYLILISCFVSSIIDAQNISIDNYTQQSDSSIQLFKNYLIDQKGLIPNHNSVLRISDFYLGTEHPMSLDFEGSGIENSDFRSFSSTVEFGVIDSSSNLSYSGIILENQVFVNKIDFYRFTNPSFAQTPSETIYNNVLNVHYPNYKLDSIISTFVRNQNGEYIGEFHTEYKTFTRKGCLVTDYYSIIPKKTYTLIGNSYNCEAVSVFYTNASAEFYVKGRCIGDQFEMYNLSNQLIHKGVLSRYMEGYFDSGK